MNILILSRKESLYSTMRLKEAAIARGHDVDIIDYLRCYININSKRPTVLYSGKDLDKYHMVIPRIGASHTFYGTAIVRQFEMMGTKTLNSSVSITKSRDKLRCMQILAKKGIGLPISGCAHSTKDAEGLIQIAGGAPVVVKLLEGTQGIGVVLAETKKAAESVIQAFRDLDAHIIIQEYIKESHGCDIRCFVIGDKVVASILRKSAEGEFRSNLHRGGTAHNVELSAEEEKTAISAAQGLGLSVAGVDILRSNHGPVVLEVNSSPGLEGVEKTTKVDIAAQVIEFIETSQKKTEA